MCLTNKDRQKLTNAGYTLIRTDKREHRHKQTGLFGGEPTLKMVTSFVIKQSTREQFNWHDRNVCDTKADLEKRLAQLLADPKILLDE